MLRVGVPRVWRSSSGQRRLCVPWIHRRWLTGDSRSGGGGDGIPGDLARAHAHVAAQQGRKPGYLAQAMQPAARQQEQAQEHTRKHEGQLPRLLPLLHSHPGDREVTVYVKGFLSPGELPDHYEHWIAAHRRLVDQHGWSPRCDGFAWQNGRLWGIGAVPAPLAMTMSAAWQVLVRGRSLSRILLPQTLALGLAQELAVLAARLAWQYRCAHDNLAASARSFAERLGVLGQHYRHVRIVAHSLGCATTLHAVAQLPPHLRPAELHLCAPAVLEEDVAALLQQGVAQQQAVVYHNTQDKVLGALFWLLHGWKHRAIGEVGLLHPGYPRMTCVDATRHFDSWWVHREYPAYLDRFVVTAPRSAPPSAPQQNG